LNAIAHRDYSIANGIEIYIFNARMEIKSPSAPISTLTIKNLYELEGFHESRNSPIARVLRENNLMSALGEGVKRIFGSMQEQELQKPDDIITPHKSPPANYLPAFPGYSPDSKRKNQSNQRSFYGINRKANKTGLEGLASKSNEVVCKSSK